MRSPATRSSNASLAIVTEAKENRRRCRARQAQAKYYADGRNRKGNRPPPLILLHQRLEIYFLNAARASGRANSLASTSRDAIEYELFQNGPARGNARSLIEKEPIVDRPTRSRRFQARHRKLRQAPPQSPHHSGDRHRKTRVAIALGRADDPGPPPANWAKRVLFLCYRSELRKQGQGRLRGTPTRRAPRLRHRVKPPAIVNQRIPF